MNKSAITKSQLADEFGFSLRTLQRKLDKAGLKIPRGLIGVDTQVLIRIKLGHTQSILIDDNWKIKKDTN